MKKFLLLGAILMALALYGSIQAISYISSPVSCADCHSGIYQNYNTTARGSILPSHENNSVTCFACHSGQSIQARIEALDTVATAKIVKDSKPWLNQLFQANFSFNRSINATKFASLRANCEKCHHDSDLPGEMHANKTACSLCHFAHIKQKINFEAVGILTHKNLKCTACHGTETEIQIPSCTKCHTPHLKNAGWDNAVCLGCHNDAHVPTRKISFAGDTPKELCSGCHASEYKNLTTSGGKHNLLPSCASCHPSHGVKMSCWTCHGQILEDSRKHFPHHGNTCNLCHLRKGGRGSPRIQCQTCHNPHNPFSGLPRPATNKQIGEIAKQRLQNLS